MRLSGSAAAHVWIGVATASLFLAPSIGWAAGTAFAAVEGNPLEGLTDESLVESLENLAEDEPFRQAFMSIMTATVGPDTRKITRRLLANRRVVKIYQQLMQMSKDEQYRLLDAYFTRYVKQNAAARQAMATGADEGERAAFLGSLRAAQSLALVSGMLGNTRMWPRLREAFRFPATGSQIEIDLDDASEHTANLLRNHPLFPAVLRAQVAYQISTLGQQLIAIGEPDTLARVGLAPIYIYVRQMERAEMDRTQHPVDYTSLIRLTHYRDRPGSDERYSDRHIRVLHMSYPPDVDKIAEIAQQTGVR